MDANLLTLVWLLLEKAEKPLRPAQIASRLCAERKTPCSQEAVLAALLELRRLGRVRGVGRADFWRIA